MNWMPILILGLATMTILVTTTDVAEDVPLLQDLNLPGTQVTLGGEVVATAIQACIDNDVPCDTTSTTALCTPIEWTQIRHDQPFRWTLESVHVQQEHATLSPCMASLRYDQAPDATSVPYLQAPCLADSVNVPVPTGFVDFTDDDGDGRVTIRVMEEDWTIDQSDCTTRPTGTIRLRATYGDTTPFPDTPETPCTDAGLAWPGLISYDELPMVEDRDGDNLEGIWTEWRYYRMDPFTCNPTLAMPEDCGFECDTEWQWRDWRVLDGDDENPQVGYRVIGNSLHAQYMPCLGGYTVQVQEPVIKDQDYDYVPYIGARTTTLGIDATCSGVTGSTSTSKQYIAGDPDDARPDADFCQHLARHRVHQYEGQWRDMDGDGSYRFYGSWQTYQTDATCTWSQSSDAPDWFGAEAVLEWFGDYDDQDAYVQGYATPFLETACMPAPRSLPTTIIGPHDVDGDGYPAVTIVSQDAWIGSCTHFQGGTTATYGDPDDTDPTQPAGSLCGGGATITTTGAPRQRDLDGDGEPSYAFHETETTINPDCTTTTQNGDAILVIGDPDEDGVDAPCDNGHETRLRTYRQTDADGDLVPRLHGGTTTYTFTNTGIGSCDWTTGGHVDDGTGIGDPDDTDPTKPVDGCIGELWAPYAPDLRDQDTDGVPVIQSREFRVWDEACTLDLDSLRDIGDPIAVDPDDNDPTRPGQAPCYDVQGQRFQYESYEFQDQDQDQVPLVLLYRNTADVQADCSFTVIDKDPDGSIGDPDDADPLNPVGCSTTQGTYGPYPGLRIRDADGDLVPWVAYGGTSTLLLDASCDATLTPCSGCTEDTGDPDDLDPGQPIPQGCPQLSIRHFSTDTYQSTFLGVPVPWLEEDRDGDGVAVYRFAATWTNTTQGCQVTNQPAHDYQVTGDPDDLDPDSPIDYTTLCAGLVGEWFWTPMPNATTTRDADGDGVPVIDYGYWNTTFTPRCQTTTAWGTGTVAVDPDDANPSDPAPPACTFVSGTYNVPKGAESEDPDEDGFRRYRIIEDTYYVDPACALTDVGDAQGPWVELDPNPADPDVPLPRNPCATYGPTISYVSWLRYTDEDGDGLGSIDAEYGNATITQDCTPRFEERGDPPLVSLDPNDGDKFVPQDLTLCTGSYHEAATGTPIVVDDDSDRLTTGLVQIANMTLGVGCVPGPSVFVENIEVGPDPDDQNNLVPGPCFAYAGTTWTFRDNATTVDEDGDLVPNLFVHWGDYTIGQDCTTTRSHNRTELQQVDNDDQDPGRPFPNRHELLCDTPEPCLLVSQEFVSSCEEDNTRACTYQLDCGSDVFCEITPKGELQPLFDSNFTTPDNPDGTPPNNETDPGDGGTGDDGTGGDDTGDGGTGDDGSGDGSGLPDLGTGGGTSGSGSEPTTGTTTATTTTAPVVTAGERQMAIWPIMLLAGLGLLLLLGGRRRRRP